MKIWTSITTHSSQQQKQINKKQATKTDGASQRNGQSIHQDKIQEANKLDNLYDSCETSSCVLNRIVCQIVMPQTTFNMVNVLKRGEAEARNTYT